MWRRQSRAARSAGRTRWGLRTAKTAMTPQPSALREPPLHHSMTSIVDSRAGGRIVMREDDDRHGIHSLEGFFSITGLFDLR